MKYSAAICTVSLRKNSVYPGYCTRNVEMKILLTFFGYRKFLKNFKNDVFEAKITKKSKFFVQIMGNHHILII